MYKEYLKKKINIIKNIKKIKNYARNIYCICQLFCVLVLSTDPHHSFELNLASSSTEEDAENGKISKYNRHYN